MVMYASTYSQRKEEAYMHMDMMYEASVSLECRSCHRRITIPALKVLQGVSCVHCGAMLVVDQYALAAKAVLITFAAGRNDTKID